MKTLRYLMFAALMAFAVVGCTTDPDDLGTNPDDSGVNGGNGGDNGSDDNGGDLIIDPTRDYPLVSTYPLFVTAEMTEDVYVIVNAKDTSMAGFNGEMYAHTGVITSASTGNSDWKYTKAGWTENTPACRLMNCGNDLWVLKITGGPRAFYGVPEGQDILKLAFVFRSADGSKEIKQNGADIFIETVVEGLHVKIVSPANGTLLTVGEEYTVVVNAQDADKVSLYRGEQEVANTANATLNYGFVPTEEGDITFKAVAVSGNDSVEDSIKISVLGSTQDAPRPAGVSDGVNIEGTSATFVLYAPGKKSVILLGDFNDYAPSNEYMMKRDGDYFWITVDNLEYDVEYGYQYFVDCSIKVGDPYAEKILDPWNDKWINASVYPDLKAYPSDYTTDIVCTFELDETPYNWTVTDFQRPKENSLAVYELLIRDFTEEGSIDAVTAKLDYLQELGVNAIELMPIQEFDGNDSWGYNPCFYFAADKAYGTEEAYKRFIDECHKRGIAVILDVVFNHATGLFPWAKMWWDGSKNCTASNNPFFNVSAPHNFSVYHDFRHLYPKTREFFKDVLKFWLEEYKVDGFRFDLTKGLVQNPGNYDAGGYSSERIEILSDYARAIRAVEPDAYVIFEHFCDQREESELYDNVGALCWNNNAMQGYKESVMGWTGNNKSSFAEFKRGRMNNIETHDEERVGYAAITWGQSYVKGNWAVISKRIQAAYIMHFLTPYPKMMWQFGELGYDVSINANDKGVVGNGDEYRTHRKPVRWTYFYDKNRHDIYEALSKAITWRTEHEDYYGSDNLAVHSWKVLDGDMGGKTLVMDRVIVVANFTNAETTTTVNVPQASTWRNLMTDAAVTLGSTYSAKLAAHDYIVLVRD